MDYKVIGFNNFFLANIDETRENSTVNYNKFKAFLMTSSSSSSTNPFLSSFVYGNNNTNNIILNMVGIANPNNSTPANTYFTCFFFYFFWFSWYVFSDCWKY